MQNNFKEYAYWVYPDVRYMKFPNDTKSYSTRKRDLHGIYQALSEGVEVNYGTSNLWGNPIFSEEDFNILAKGETDDNACKKVLKFFKDRIENITGSTNVPMYLIKVPKSYKFFGRDFTRQGLLPLPYLKLPKSYELTDKDCQNPFAYRNLNKKDFEFEEGYIPLINNECVYGVYTSALGGFYKNPEWTPLPKYPYLILDKSQFLNCHQINDFLIQYDLQKKKVFTESKLKEFLEYQNFKVYNFTDVDVIKSNYENIYGEDVPDKSALSPMMQFINRANDCMDISELVK